MNAKPGFLCVVSFCYYCKYFKRIIINLNKPKKIDMQKRAKNKHNRSFEIFFVSTRSSILCTHTHTCIDLAHYMNFFRKKSKPQPLVQKSITRRHVPAIAEEDEVLYVPPELLEQEEFLKIQSADSVPELIEAKKQKIRSHRAQILEIKRGLKQASAELADLSKQLDDTTDTIQVLGLRLEHNAKRYTHTPTHPHTPHTHNTRPHTHHTTPRHK